MITGVFLGVGFFIFSTGSRAAESDLHITEIMYDPAGSDTKNEWLELKNTGAGAVEIIGGSIAAAWRLFDGVNHTFSTSTSLGPGEYCVAVQDEATFLSSYPLYGGKILQSSFTLTNSSGTVGLRVGSDGILWSEINYDNDWGGGGNGKTLEKKDEAGAFTQENWQESPFTGGTPGAWQSTEPVDSTPVLASSTPELPEETASSTVPAAPAPAIEEIKINEIYPIPAASAEKEWVELFNPTSSTINLAGWFLLDNSSTTSLEGEVLASGFLVVEFSSRLNNSGDRLILKDSDGEIMDQVTYGDFDDGDLSDNLPPPAAGTALARKIDGLGMGNIQNDFSLTVTPTKKGSNIITEPIANVAPSDRGGGSGSVTKTSATEVPKEGNSVNIVVPAAERLVVINELLPNPKGSDTQKEMIELKNISGGIVNLEGWFLTGSNKRKHFFTSSTVLLPGEFLVLARSQTKITLKNSGGDFVDLYNQDKHLVDKAIYQETAEEDFVLVRTATTTDMWAWSTAMTPGRENILVAPNYPPEAFFSLPSVLMVEEEGFFEAGDTFDPDDDTLSFLWDLDGNLLEGETVVFSFKSPGKKKIALIIDDNHGHVVTKKTFLQVEGEKEGVAENVSVPIVKVNKSKNKIRQDVSLGEIKNLAVGDLARTKGIVVVLPGIFSTQMFFIEDPLSGAGLPVYMYSKDFPLLKIGDEVEIRGELGSYLGSLRLKVKNKADMDILSIDNKTVTPFLSTGDIDDDKLFSLAQLEGEILETASGYFYLGDDQGEIKIVLKSKTGLKGKVAGLGDRVRVTGVIGKSKDSWVLWPRGADDLQILQVANAVDKQGAKEVTEKYLTATAGGVTSLLLALLARGRGALAKAVAFGFLGKLVFWKKKDDV